MARTARSAGSGFDGAQAVIGRTTRVRGRVSGAIVAKQVKLFATARIEGDITQEQLSIEQGAWFQGRCTQAKRDTPGANMLESPTPAEKPAPAKTDAKVEAKPAA